MYSDFVLPAKISRAELSILTAIAIFAAKQTSQIRASSQVLFLMLTFPKNTTATTPSHINDERP